MPPRPNNSRLSNCGNNSASSVAAGGVNPAKPGPGATDSKAACRNRQAGHNPCVELDAMARPHCGQLPGGNSGGTANGGKVLAR